MGYLPHDPLAIQFRGDDPAKSQTELPAKSQVRAIARSTGTSTTADMYRASSTCMVRAILYCSVLRAFSHFYAIYRCFLANVKSYDL